VGAKTSKSAKEYSISKPLNDTASRGLWVHPDDWSDARACTRRTWLPEMARRWCSYGELLAACDIVI
jgi:hypothetical protein